LKIDASPLKPITYMAEMHWIWHDCYQRQPIYRDFWPIRFSRQNPCKPL